MKLNQGVKLATSAVKRVFLSTRYVEQLRRQPLPPLNTAVDFGGCVVIKVTTATGRMSGGTPDVTGRGYLQAYSGSGSFANASTTAYPLLNTTNYIFAIGAYVTCAPCYGMWVIINPDKCANVS